MFKKLFTVIIIFSLSFSMNENLTEQQREEIRNKVVEEFAKKIFASAMEAKRAMMSEQTREQSLLDNFATTAPRDQFIFNADIDSSLAYGVESATVFASTDNQNSWISSPAAALNTAGYENTWEATIANDGGQNISWYISGEADSEPLGFDYGRILVSQTPFNSNNSFPPPSSYYALLAEDPAGDASSNQDVLNLKGTYSNDKIFMSLGLNGGCCDEGSFFGPWYLYGVAIVNPEAETAVAYAIGYGDGGFGQLSPGLYKITGRVISATCCLISNK